MQKILVMIGVLMTVTVTQAAAENLRGARALFDMVTKYANVEEEPVERPVDEWRAAVAAYKANPPADARQAAADWQALYFRLWEVREPQNEALYAPNPALKALIAAIPGPEAWGHLLDLPVPDGQQDSAAGQVWWYITGALAEDEVRMNAALDALETGSRSGPEWQQEYARELIRSMRRELIMGHGSAQPQIKLFMEALVAEQTERSFHEVEVPDLVTILGKTEARELLIKALKTGGVLLKVPVGDETRAMAIKTALEMIDDIREPQWLLTMEVGPQPQKLYEALEKEFGPLPAQYRSGAEVADGSDSGEPLSIGEMLSEFMGIDDEGSADPPYGSLYYFQAQARPYYMVSLMLAGRQAEAMDIAFEVGLHRDGLLTGEIMNFMQETGHTRELVGFLKEVLTVRPQLGWWDVYIALAAQMGMREEPEQMISARLADSGIDPDRRLVYQVHLLRLYLAFDDIPAAESIVDGISLDLTRRPVLDLSDYQQTAVKLARTLTRAGTALDKQEWVERGLEILRKLAGRGGLNQYFDSSAEQTLVRELIQLDRLAEAEEVLFAGLERFLKRLNNPLAIDGMAGYWQYAEYLPLLVVVYHKSGRYADIVRLTERIAFWQYGGLFATLEKGFVDIDFGYHIAHALYKTGQTEKAAEILKHLIMRDGGYDPAYEGLVKIVGPGIIPWLDEVYATDHFEERPLIWKAHLLAQEKQWEAARSVIEQAIAIDPSDGEQGQGRRMRAYAVLAVIHQALGDAEQAVFYEDVVKAIRQAEQADELYAAGLVTRAVREYEAALDRFADAYCIQSRAAVYQESLGNTAAAEKHLRRAYELMPSSFGQMESHCFGCEKAFATLNRQQIAEEVFQSLLKQMPDNPRVQYLMGYLRQEQGRAEAKDYFWQAVRLDPDYINAWKNLQRLSDHAYVPAAEQQEIVLNLLRLDPYARHSSPELGRVHSLRALWSVSAGAPALPVSAQGEVYPFPATQERLDGMANEQRMMFYGTGDSDASTDVSVDPARRLSEHNVFVPLYTLVKYLQ